MQSWRAFNDVHCSWFDVNPIGKGTSGTLELVYWGQDDIWIWKVLRWHVVKTKAERRWWLARRKIFLARFLFKHSFENPERQRIDWQWLCHCCSVVGYTCAAYFVQLHSTWLKLKCLDVSLCSVINVWNPKVFKIWKPFSFLRLVSSSVNAVLWLARLVLYILLDYFASRNVILEISLFGVTKVWNSNIVKIEHFENTSFSRHVSNSTIAVL